MNRPSTPLQILYPKCDKVSNLVAAARRLQAITEALRECLPAEERSHLCAVTINGHSSVMWVDSPAWTTRFRYSVPVFLSALNTLPGAEKVATLQVKTLPQEMQEPPASLPLRRLSPDAGQIISACAAHIEHPLLRAALQRLASNTAPRRKTSTD